jgi:polyphenol oxidase
VSAPVSNTTPTLQLTQHVERSRLLAAIPWLRHGVTRRVAGLGRADGNVGYTAPRDEVDAWQMRKLWAHAIGIDPFDLVRVRQMHGNIVRVATELDTERGTHPDANEAPIGDAIVTSVPNVALMTLHADCLAMFLVDPEHRAVGAVHAGWRSTVQDIAGETVRSMAETFGSRPESLIAYVGPSISAERYAVGEEVVDQWLALDNADQRACRRADDSWWFDLKAANASRLINAGLAASKIEVSSVCTATDGERWFSHRGQGPLTGRFAAIISIAGDQR